MIAKAFVVRISGKAERCEFNNTEERVQELLIQGCRDEKVRRAALHCSVELNDMVIEASLSDTFRGDKR